MSSYERKEKLRIQVCDNKIEKEHFHQDIELIYLLEERLEKYLQQDGQKVEEKIDSKNKKVTCRVTDTSDLKNHWGQIINIGSAADLLNKRCRNILFC